MQHVKGRGTPSNTPSRYLSVVNEAVDDGWYLAPQEEFTQRRVPTQLLADRTKTLITTNSSPDISFNQSINPYKGCEHGCVYCFARPTHTYLDLSAGLDFETKLFYKTNPRAHLIKELGKARYRCNVIAMGTNTDPYQPVEKQQRVTREVLETLLACHHPVSIVTKSALILRDLDLLSELGEKGLVNVHVSVTTLDNGLKTKLEPRTAAPGARLRTIETLANAGVPVGAMLAPVIPFINDHELEAMAQACTAAGAQALGYILIRLPLEVHPLFEEWLEQHFPLKAQRVMSAIRDTREGQVYRAQWHQRMVGKGQLAQLLQQRFTRAVHKAGLQENRLPRLRTDLFVPPTDPADTQLNLF